MLTYATKYEKYPAKDSCKRFLERTLKFSAVSAQLFWILGKVGLEMMKPENYSRKGSREEFQASALGSQLHGIPTPISK